MRGGQAAATLMERKSKDELVAPDESLTTDQRQEGGGAYEARISGDGHVVSWLGLDHARALLAWVGLALMMAGPTPQARMFGPILRNGR